MSFKFVKHITIELCVKNRLVLQNIFKSYLELHLKLFKKPSPHQLCTLKCLLKRYGPNRPAADIQRNCRVVIFWPQRPLQPPNSLGVQFVSKSSYDNMFLCLFRPSLGQIWLRVQDKVKVQDIAKPKGVSCRIGAIDLRVRPKQDFCCQAEPD